jgi:DNA-binding MarR family transcriptional regulator/GNAT superfamily N-acetyltransferase
MVDSAVAQVRSFNRLVTQAVGALNDRYLSRDRPLGEARVLWEIGTEGCELRELRARLGLDSGYLSRLIASLEEAGLISVQPNHTDRRVRMARLTRTGRAERNLLERRSDELARSFLQPLSEQARNRLVSAMAEVERLLTSALVEITPLDPTHPHAQSCLQQYIAELNKRFPAGFDPTMSIPADPHELRPPQGLFLIATLPTGPVGCGALKLHGTKPAELKRMWTAETARGLGIGRRLLSELERHATAAGAPTIRLETNNNLTEAINLYRSAGYREVAAFNDDPYADHWLEKQLQP